VTSRERRVTQPEELIFVVDLTAAEIDRASREIDAGGPRPPPPELPDAPPSPVSRMALLIDGWDEPLLLPIEPTLDVAWLDAVARLLRIAALAGERVPAVAVNYGEVLERTLAFERRLPEWAYTGVDDATSARLPPELRVVLGPRRGRRGHRRGVEGQRRRP
jgi:hypothetical protein